jgi:hypothetical protein
LARVEQAPLVQDPPSDREPEDHRERIGDREGAYVQSRQPRQDEDEHGGADVAHAHEEGVHRLLGAVLHLLRRRKPEHVPNGVVERVIERVLRDPPDPHERQGGDDRNHGGVEERNDGQDQEGHPDAGELHDPRDEERLHQRADDVHVKNELDVEAADEVAAGHPRGQLPRRLQRARQVRYEGAEEVLAVGVDESEEHREDGQKRQVAVAEHHLERARAAVLLRRLSRLPRGALGELREPAPLHPVQLPQVDHLHDPRDHDEHRGGDARG